MGMTSTCLTQDIEIKNHDALRKIKKELDTMGLLGELDHDLMDVDFHEWTGHKIEGYWYDETIKILRAIAPHIEGSAEFMYEEGYNFRILFENGKVYFQRAEVSWNKKEEL